MALSNVSVNKESPEVTLEIPKINEVCPDFRVKMLAHMVKHEERYFSVS